MTMPKAVLLAAEPAGGRYRRLVIGRPDSDAHEAMLNAYQRAGQYVLLRTPDAGEANYFAMSRAPGDEPSGFEFLVNPVGPVGESLAKLPVGAAIEMSDPMGAGYPFERARGRDVLVLAAGSGIGPLRALIDTLIRARSEHGWIRLYYGQSQPDDFGYRDWLATLPEHGVEVSLVASKPSIDHRGPMGYVQEVADTEVNYQDSSRLVVALCGMPAMEQDARKRAAARGVASERLLTNL
jgi:NAD(P)H-flavin reductase